MTGPTWRIDDEDGSPEITGAPLPLLVTGRALVDALARTWRIWVAATIIGALLGVAAFFAVPHPASAETTLFMVHPEEGESAMTTDLNLLLTTTVASRVLADLDLEQSPEGLLSTVTVTPVNEQLLALEVSGPDEASAVERATSLVENFFEFRAEELRSVSDGLIEGYQARITDLTSQVDALSRQYQQLSAEESAADPRAGDILTARSTLATEITRLQSDIEEASIRTEGAIKGTHVVDAPRASPYGSRRQSVLLAASGAILLGGLCIGTILLRSLTSDRLRRRREVAGALGVPVRVGVGPVSSRGFLERTEAALASRVAGVFRGHPASRTDRRRRRNFEALVQGMESAVPPRLRSGAPHGGTGGHPPVKRRSGPTTLGLAAIDRTDTAAAILRATGERIADRGVPVLLVDLTSTGALSAAPGLSASLGEPGTPRVYRPEGDPAFTSGPRRYARRPVLELEELGVLGAAWNEADLVLVLVEVDPGFDLQVLRTWVSAVVPLVSAGRASGELLSTIAGLVAEAGLDMPFALLEGADRSDQTLGRPAPIIEDPSELAEVQSQ